MNEAANSNPEPADAVEGFRFSPLITTVSVTLAVLMFWASRWQWTRYLEKVALRESYAETSAEPPTPFRFDEAREESQLDPLLNRKVELRGTYDLDLQLIVTNRSHSSGPGHHLFAPFRLSGSDRAVLVSRGFIPFADRDPSSWAKYDVRGEQTIQGVVKRAKAAGRTPLSPQNPAVGEGRPYQRVWLFEEVGKMVQQLPYPTFSSVFVEKVPRTGGLRGAAGPASFPAEQVSFEVPPSTHFGYTIEWALLAMASLGIGYALQAFPGLRRLLRGARGRAEWQAHDGRTDGVAGGLG